MGLPIDDRNVDAVHWCHRKPAPQGLFSKNFGSLLRSAFQLGVEMSQGAPIEGRVLFKSIL
jgi:hypothetical protein